MPEETGIFFQNGLILFSIDIILDIMEVIINEDQALQAVLGKYEYFKSFFAHLSYSYAGVDVFVGKKK